MGQVGDGAAIDIHRIQIPGLSLKRVVKLTDPDEVGAHGPHFFGKHHDAIEQVRIFEVLHDLVPIGDGLAAAQGEIEQRFEVVFRPIGCDRVHNLIEIKIGETGWRGGLLCALAIVRRVEEDAGKRDGSHKKSHQSRCLGRSYQP